jgi:hypothetical protein
VRKNFAGNCYKISLPHCVTIIAGGMTDFTLGKRQKKDIGCWYRIPIRATSRRNLPQAQGPDVSFRPVDSFNHNFLKED